MHFYFFHLLKWVVTESNVHTHDTEAGEAPQNMLEEHHLPIEKLVKEHRLSKEMLDCFLITTPCSSWMLHARTGRGEELLCRL